MSQIGEQVYFGITDYVMLAAMLGFSLGIGIFFAIRGNKTKTKFEYLLGSRQMGALPVALSLFATFHSAISLLGTPAEVYTYGTMIVYSTIVPSLSFLFMTVTSVPLFYPLKLTSVNEYLERRYNSKFVRILGTFLGIISSMSYMTISLLSPGLALQTVAGLPLWLSIVVIGLIGTFYTTIGGLKSVIWTDVFQTFIIFGGIIVILVKGSYDSGGIENVMKVAADNGRMIFDDIRIDPRVRHTVWDQSIGGFVYWASSGFSQSTVQRISSVKSPQQANGVFFLSVPLAFLYKTVLILSGLVLVAYFFVMECDPLAAGYVTNANQLMPYFVMLTLGFLPGLPGIYIATIFSGALSTLSSGLNSLAANTVEDFLSHCLTKKSEATVTFITKIIVSIYGLGIIGLAYLLREFSGPVTQLTYSAISAASAPLTGLFFFGAAFPQAEVVGGLFGISVGLAVNIWLTLGSFMYGARAPRLPLGTTVGCSSANTTSAWAVARNVSSAATSPSTGISGIMRSTTKTITYFRTDKEFSLYDLSYSWSPVIGVTVTVIAGLFGSVIYRTLSKSPVTSDPALLFPWAKRLWCIKDIALDSSKEINVTKGDQELAVITSLKSYSS
ncbi:Sodium-dependent multivitamin transporter [Biomphalaria glabrata]|uniref:Sodium-coupled monocarboxylate transporter 2-like isoform X1 n=2 Tax=Biomphalaria glabrata TaxID=6526 RepID=A0A9W2ZRJ9_BIOGL|nr:sodium-coupled monocarboxylate transporter 2-like isoform X1 [Biomphalaria glabrata]XP_055877614.1 sodium-coupled monocarboxylate transporter 2-like isoform X1 [Biomphalaria glabrata]XP_055877615.1 sodium-coupled monocarboxylate transporter 2-like isoform X1 [Biomphalaria glabrata]KAI8764762.1 sodium-dependent multivitamin transporter-like [Biomphalaria glabrata]